ncbi:MAG: hypothetical protein A2234_10890 [Elusimicrobia bacterium RIFOXYA2_FULL_58_8]|nr:MAG: hypothetical protein A2234_10890 [Elusimicrobia bacterium RIFOXYA2_FULL_58_8]
MKSPEFRKTAAYLAAALFIGGAWAFHMAGAHDAADNDCQVCAVSCSPELNSDCGSGLITKPEDFRRITPVLSVVPAKMTAVLSFYGRAPPLA